MSYTSQYTGAEIDDKLSNAAQVDEENTFTQNQTMNGNLDVDGQITEGGNRVVESGSNSDGEWVRFADGTQICSINNFEANYNNNTQCSSTWSFPVSFSDPPNGWADFSDGFGGDATPSYDEIINCYCLNETTTDSNVTAIRAAGLTDFESGDIVMLSCFAIGRWY